MVVNVTFVPPCTTCVPTLITIEYSRKPGNGKGAAALEGFLPSASYMHPLKEQPKFILTLGSGFVVMCTIVPTRRGGLLGIASQAEGRGTI